MPGTIRLGALPALLAVAVALPGCGSDEISGEIPPDNATDLNSALASVRDEIEAGCIDPDQARERAQAFLDEVNELPADPSGEVKQELQEAAGHLRTLVENECASTEPAATTQSTTPPTSSSSTESSTTESSTTESSTTETSTGTTTGTDEPPPGNGNGGGPPDGGPPGNGGTGGTGGPSDGDDE